MCVTWLLVFGQSVWPSGDAGKKHHCGDSEHKIRPIQPQINPVKQGNAASGRGKTLEVLVEV